MNKERFNHRELQVAKSEKEPGVNARQSSGIDALRDLLRKANQKIELLTTENCRLQQELARCERQESQMEKLHHRLAEINAEAAQMIAEQEERSEALQCSNTELARANAYASELVAALELKEEDIRNLNQALSRSNARAAQLLADRELQLERLEQMNRRLGQEVRDRKRAESELAQLADELRVANQNLDRLSTIDPLTGLLNRRGLERHLDMEQSRARRMNTRLGAIFADLDDFKSINDGLGHVVGDIVLKEVSRRIQTEVRGSDSAGRFGGDEFLCLVPVRDEKELEVVAHRVCHGISATPVSVDGQELPMSASIGVAMVPPTVDSLAAVVEGTREALKISKNEGKNRVTLCEL